MKNLIVVFALFILIGCDNKKENYLSEIKEHQYEQNVLFADPEKTPLTTEGLATFKALEFFDIDQKYQVKAIFELTPDAPVFEMQTTTERLPLYKKYGIARFTIDGKQLELSIYQNQKLLDNIEYQNYLFLPFKDRTNGTSSYGGGRFIDMKVPEEGHTEIIIDFNKAYNPLCAYNHKYSCPIPPIENHLDIAVPAGVKGYNEPH